MEQNTAPSGIDLKQTVEKLLRDAQKNKSFKDSDIRVGGSKKEMAAIRKLLRFNLDDLAQNEAQYGEVAMIKFVKKDQIFPKYDIKAQMNMGVSSGAAFLKVKLRASFPNEPSLKTSNSRKVYVGFANLLYDTFLNIATVESFLETQKKIVSNTPKIVSRIFFEDKDAYTGFVQKIIEATKDGEHEDVRTDFISFDDAYDYLGDYTKKMLKHYSEAFDKAYLVGREFNLFQGDFEKKFLPFVAKEKERLKDLIIPNYCAVHHRRGQEEQLYEAVMGMYNSATKLYLLTNGHWAEKNSYIYKNYTNSAGEFLYSNPFWIASIQILGDELMDKAKRPISKFSYVSSDGFLSAFFSTTFDNFMSMPGAYQGTWLEVRNQAYSYQGISEEKSLLLTAEKTKGPKEELATFQELLLDAITIDSVKKLNEALEKKKIREWGFFMTYYNRKNRIVKDHVFLSQLFDTDDRMRWLSLYMKHIENEIVAIQKRIVSLKEKYAPRQDDWSWAADYLGEQGQPAIESPSGEEIKPKKRKIHSRPMLDYIERKGGLRIDKSKISDIEQMKKFMTEFFGFRAYEFGKSLRDEDATEIIFHFLGAISDFAEILDIDLASLNKQMGLSMGFASRGSGSASAHYECLGRIINLTKSNGDGSLAHEMAHYLDNIIPDLDHPEKYIYAQWATVEKDRQGGLAGRLTNPSVADAMQQIMYFILYGKKKQLSGYNAFYDTGKGSYVEYVATAENAGTKTLRSYFSKKVENLDDLPSIWAGRFSRYQYFENLTRGDLVVFDIAVRDAGLMQYTFRIPSRMSMYYTESQKVGGDYWIRPWELFARAFEVYVSDKLVQAGRMNTYLCKGEYQSFSEEYVPDYPYPQFEERKYLFGLFENLFTQLRQAYQIGRFVPFTDQLNVYTKDEINIVDSEEVKKLRSYERKMKVLMNILSEKKEAVFASGGRFRQAMNEETDNSFNILVLECLDELENLKRRYDVKNTFPSVLNVFQNIKNHGRSKAIEMLYQGTEDNIPLEKLLTRLYAFPDWEKRLRHIDHWAFEINRNTPVAELKEEILLVLANQIIEQFDLMAANPSIANEVLYKIKMRQAAIDCVSVADSKSDIGDSGYYVMPPKFYPIIGHRFGQGSQADLSKFEGEIRSLIAQVASSLEIPIYGIERLYVIGHDFEKAKPFGFNSVLISDNGHGRYQPKEIERITFGKKDISAELTICQAPNGFYLWGYSYYYKVGGSSSGCHLDEENAAGDKQSCYNAFYIDAYLHFSRFTNTDALMSEIESKLHISDAVKADASKRVKEELLKEQRKKELNHASKQNKPEMEKPSRVWMQPAETEAIALDRLIKQVEQNITNPVNEGFIISAFIDKQGENTEVYLLERAGKFEWHYDKNKRPFASFNTVKEAVSFIMKQPFWDDGSLNQSGRNDDYFKAVHKNYLQRQIESGAVLRDINDGLVSADAAIEIIKNAGLAVPKEIEDKVANDNYAKGGKLKTREQIKQALKHVDFAPSVKYWMQPEFSAETSKYPQSGEPNEFKRFRFSGSSSSQKKWASDDIVAYDAYGNIVGSISVDNMLNRGAFKIVVREDAMRQGWGMKLLDEAERQGIFIDFAANSFTSQGRALATHWLEQKLNRLK